MELLVDLFVCLFFTESQVVKCFVRSKCFDYFNYINHF